MEKINQKNSRIAGKQDTKFKDVLHFWSWLASGAPPVVWLAMGAGLVTIFCPRMGHSKRNSDLSFKIEKEEKRGGREKKKFCNYLGHLPNVQAGGRPCRVRWCGSTSFEAVHTGTWRLFSWLQTPHSSWLLFSLLLLLSFFLLSRLPSISLVCRRLNYLQSGLRYKIKICFSSFRF